MSIIINKPGQTINDVSYGFLQVELNPFIELHYDRVSVNTKCYDGLDASMFSPIIPKDWDRFNPIKIPFELEASTNLEEWAHEKCVEALTTTKNVPYEYMAYETDIFDLDPSTGDPVLDPCTNEPIVLHTQGELIKKANGTYMFYTKILPIFCELEDVSIKL